jgi:predicted AAA+ superfamily ATPase
LVNEIESKSDSTKTNYVFLDEIQEINNFEKCIITLFENKKYKYDIYITGSNSHMFSEELATLFTGRTKKIKIFPFTFKEVKENVLTSMSEYDALFEYLKYGGLGVIVPFYKEYRKAVMVLHETLEDILTKDIFLRYKIKTRNDFEKIIDFTFSQLSNRISATKLGNYLKSKNEVVVSKSTILRFLK